jgi:hypothetical protein
MARFPDWSRWHWLYDWLSESDSLGFGVPFIGIHDDPSRGIENRVETVQLLSILFVIAFLAMFAAIYWLTEMRRRQPAEDI